MKNMFSFFSQLDSISICTCVIVIIGSNLITNLVLLCTQPVMRGSIAVFITSDICGGFCRNRNYVSPIRQTTEIMYR